MHPVGDGLDTAADTRLILQLGMLFAALYAAFLCVWFSTTRHLRVVGVGQSLRLVLRRARPPWTAAVAESGDIVRPRPVSRAVGPAAAADSLWICEIAWLAGDVRSRFQAVMARRDGRMQRVIAESKGLRWPPEDVRRPSTCELEAALGALVASIVAAGWEPVPSGGSWSQRRFVWRREGEPPARLEPAGEDARRVEIFMTPASRKAERDRRPLVAARPGAPAPGLQWRPKRGRAAAGQGSAYSARRRAVRGANREAVLRVVAEHPGVTPGELSEAASVKRGSLGPLLRSLTRHGELEKRALPGGRTGYVLGAAFAASSEQPPPEALAGGRRDGSS